MKGIFVIGPKQVEVKETAMPESAPGKVLLKVTYAGVCGSDSNFWISGGPQDHTIGHEMIGVVEDPNGTEFVKGERVSMIEYNPCGECPTCKKGLSHLCGKGLWTATGIGSDGTFAEYVAVRADMVRRIPDNVSDRHAALVEPTAVAMHAARVGGVKEGSRVLITGAGTIGLLIAACAKALGAEYVATTARNEKRLTIARNCSFIDEVFDGKDSEMKEKLAAKSFDVALDCSGAAPLITMCAEVLVTGGTFVIVAGHADVTMPYSAILMKELTVKGSFFFKPQDFEDVLTFMSDGRINVEHFATDIMSFSDAQKAFEDLTSGSSANLKILLDPEMN